jgi:hypothetical protein
MNKGAYLGIFILAALMITPVVFGGRPGSDTTTVDTSILTGDFVAGPTMVQWTSYNWLVPYTFAQNIQNSPGGPIIVYDLPTRFSTGETDNGRSYISWSTHGEKIFMKDTKGNFMKEAELNRVNIFIRMISSTT